MKHNLKILLAIILVFMFCSVATAAKYKFRVAYTDAPRLKVGNEKLVHVTVAAVYAFDDSVNAMTGGAFDVQFKHSGVLGGQIETIDQVLAGAIEATTPAIPALAGYFPQVQILSIPYLWDNPVVAWEVLDGEFGQKFFDRMAKESNLRVIAIFDNGGYRNFSNNVRLVKTPADMKGIKIRTMESPAQMKIVESLGAAPTPIAWKELYSSLQTGVVDGQENPLMNIHASKLFEVQKFISLTGHKYEMTPFLMSKRTWDRLAEADRKLVQEAATEATALQRKLSKESDDMLVADLKAKGVQVDAVDKASFQRATASVVAKWEGSPIGAFVKQVVAAARAQ